MDWHPDLVVEQRLHLLRRGQVQLRLSVVIVSDQLVDDVEITVIDRDGKHGSGVAVVILSPQLDDLRHLVAVANAGVKCFSGNDLKSLLDRRRLEVGKDRADNAVPLHLDQVVAQDRPRLVISLVVLLLHLTHGFGGEVDALDEAEGGQVGRKSLDFLEDVVGVFQFHDDAEVVGEGSGADTVVGAVGENVLRR